ncbi:MAG TPA: TspO/MBR family protein [Gemmatimonas sp.]|nr:TspO/MBR family protein [Gemmatimonas sp.]
MNTISQRIERERNGDATGWLSLALFGVATAAVVSLATAGSGAARPSTLGWYKRLDQPSYKPPDPVIPAAWSVLYTASAISAWRVWRTEDSPERRTALALWGAQLVANGLWTRLFFGHKRPDFALVDSAVLFAGAAAYAVAADKVDRPAAMLMLPYLGWVGFATKLNADIVKLNPEESGGDGDEIPTE